MTGRALVLVSALALAGCTNGPCDSRCLEVGKCVVATTQQCVDCLEDRHCRGNPLAFGPTCDVPSNRCVCTTDADCAGIRNGGRCDEVLRRCHCDQDSDCLPGTRCAGRFLSTRICVAPCRSDSDCPALEAPHCDVASGDCVACVTADHCHDSPEGTRCEDHRCTCKTDADCKGSYPWGNRCREEAARCGCETDADCAGNPNGPTCADNRRCTCDRDSDCTVAPYTDCALPNSAANFMHCQRPCTTDADCQRKGGLKVCAGGTCAECTEDKHCSSAYAPHCDVQENVCVNCTADADCGGYWCDAETHGCVQCRTDTDCASSSAGPWCRWDFCECETDADCSKSPDGVKCTSYQRCGCEVDADCKASSAPKCYYKMLCGCETDAQCTVAPYSRCAQTSAYSGYLHCREPCTSDADCTDEWSLLSRCKLPDAKCVQCLGDSDCSSGSSKYCLLASNICVECRSDLDCAGSSRPLCLVSTGKCVTCTTDQDCAKSEDGRACDAASGRCTCRTDADCASLPFKKVCDPAAGCRECKEDSDCGPASLGNKCNFFSQYGADEGTCYCSTDEDCATNETGHKCIWVACSCVTDADCPTPRKCTGYYFSVAICQ